MKIFGHILPYIGFNTEIVPIEELDDSLDVSEDVKESVKLAMDMFDRNPTHVVVKGFAVAWLGYAAIWEQKIGLLFKGDL